MKSCRYLNFSNLSVRRFTKTNFLKLFLAEKNEVMITSFLDLDVYKESFLLSTEIEELLKSYPASEKFLLVDQMRRASRSIPAQIAEGYARREALKDFQRYLRDCVGESNEMINHILLSKHKRYIKKEKGSPNSLI